MYRRCASIRYLRTRQHRLGGNCETPRSDAFPTAGVATARVSRDAFEKRGGYVALPGRRLTHARADRDTCAWGAFAHAPAFFPPPRGAGVIAAVRPPLAHLGSAHNAARGAPSLAPRQPPVGGVDAHPPAKRTLDDRRCLCGALFGICSLSGYFSWIIEAVINFGFLYFLNDCSNVN